MYRRRFASVCQSTSHCNRIFVRWNGHDAEKGYAVSVSEIWGPLIPVFGIQAAVIGGRGSENAREDLRYPLSV